MQNEIKTWLKDLDFTPNEIKVYIALTELGEAPASKIAKKADLPRTTTIGILDALAKNKYISIHYYHGVAQYWIESPKLIKESLLAKAKIAESLSLSLTELYRSEADFPEAEIYDTKSGIKKFIEKTLLELPKGSVIYTIDAPKIGNYVRILSPAVYHFLAELKKERKLLTCSLVPAGSYAGIDMKKIAGQNIKIRELPKEIKYRASMWLIGDLLVHFSGRYPFVVAIRHKMIKEDMQSLYDFLWNISEPKN